MPPTILYHLLVPVSASGLVIGIVSWFLAGPDASYITGTVLTVDGGLTVTF
ncbi:MAG: hypothetical protein ABIN01_12195 [Ferruginibacter sp.]